MIEVHGSIWDQMIRLTNVSSELISVQDSKMGEGVTTHGSNNSRLHPLFRRSRALNCSKCGPYQQPHN